MKFNLYQKLMSYDWYHKAILRGTELEYLIMFIVVIMLVILV
jgi:hypothetical protein